MSPTILKGCSFREIWLLFLVMTNLIVVVSVLLAHMVTKKMSFVSVDGSSSIGVRRDASGFT